MFSIISSTCKNAATLQRNLFINSSQIVKNPTYYLWERKFRKVPGTRKQLSQGELCSVNKRHHCGISLIQDSVSELVGSAKVVAAEEVTEDTAIDIKLCVCGEGMQINPAHRLQQSQYNPTGLLNLAKATA